MAISAKLKGLDKMLKRLDELKTVSAKRAATAAVKGALPVLAADVRKRATQAPASTAVKREARKTVRWRLIKMGEALRGARALASVGKVGFGVGKQSAAKKAKASARAKSGHGVGLSQGTVHWFVLGTEERYSATQRSSSRGNSARALHHTGRIEAVLKKCIPAAMRGSSRRAMEAARKKSAVVLRREAARLRSK